MDALGRTASLADAWPLFGLRIRSERLTLRLPTDDELLDLLEIARDIHPPDEMPFGVAWSVLPTPEFERGFMQHHWLMRGRWTPESWDLNLMVELEGRPIGSQSLHARDFATHRIVESGSWLGRPWQGLGLGREMRSAALSFAFDGLGARAARSGAFLDNAASAGVSRSLGYEEDGRDVLAPQGVSRETMRFRMTAEVWRSRPRPRVEMAGLEECRELFGA